MAPGQEVPGLDELLQRLDAQGEGDVGEKVSSTQAAPEVAPGQRLWSHEIFVGSGKAEPVANVRERVEKTYQECDSLAALKPGVRLGRAPFKQRAAEEGAQKASASRAEVGVSSASGSGQAAPLVAGTVPQRRPRAAAPPAAARAGTPEAAEPDCPWRITAEPATAGKSRPAEELPGLHGLKPRAARFRERLKEKKGDDPPPQPVRQEPVPNPFLPRMPREAPPDDGELFALMAGAPLRGHHYGGEGQRQPTGDAQGSARERSSSRRSTTEPEAGDLLQKHQQGEHLLGEEVPCEGEGTDRVHGDLPDAGVEAKEPEPGPSEQLQELRQEPDTFEPGSFKIAGTWDNFQHNAMISVGLKFVYFVPVGEKGWESFQILHKGDWSRTLYPSVADGNPFERHFVLGPDDKGHGKNWTIGRHARDRAPPGTYYKVELDLGDPNEPALVRWEPVGPEAAARRARDAALAEELALHDAQPVLEEEAPDAALPQPAIRPLTGAWDGVPVNLGQAYDVGSAFTISVHLRTPVAHAEQGGRILAKRKGRSGWELVAPRRDTGEVSFYSSGGGHLNIGPTRVDDGAWHHVAAVLDERGEMRSYIDGRLDGAVAHIVRPQPEAELWLGTRTENSGLFVGDLADVQVFDSALGQEEISLLAEAGSRRKS
uniref:LamG-like jellyroll fold domain-containing protein n=1 Tax=Alexandrium monilatum TaxID=311494 RepID=A0A7S4R7G4_9DINO